MIGIIDYGMGNLHSVSKAIERLGYQYIISGNKEELGNASTLLLPGVGAFGDAMDNLNRLELTEEIIERAVKGTPILGICLGMQLLFEQSEEYGIHQGLGLLPGKVVRFQGDYKIPHMGWNQLHFLQREHPLLTGLEEGHVYFVHSYYVKTENRGILLAAAQYHQEVPAVVGRGRIIGMQFHPEKSSAMGMALLKRFLEESEVGVWA
ncbi:imidazole glycerol phosphate synthase subunit HisH [Microaerobacter geothermalis]|uniref:imidazole glycerol phosphate synthase subunit HisH n=1 Tax=Microaerobacter geothermalis TaxID=674972 RepID=UPI001F3239B0|nr:imidazole glycerol phosphate synthase subunit HisH [Microaerobacter geothermalis]MCF6094570.1 imidazole glycerol phosphate synthase subunit HisH [Microaerobacter geothermalis]